MTTKEFAPLSGRTSPRFSGVKTFLRLPEHDNPKDVDAMIVGVPFDALASYRPGARFGPTALREASSLGRAYHWEHQADVFKKTKACDGGDVFINTFKAEESFNEIQKTFSNIVKNDCTPIAVGGDHSITLPILRALKDHHGSPVALFHVDAHADTYGPAWGVEVHHGTFVRHAVNEDLIDPKKSIQIGLRGGLAAPEDFTYGKEKGFQTLLAQEIHTKPWQETLNAIDVWKKTTNKTPVYISFDIDGVDPSFAPGTGTPVPGGLTSWQALALLQTLQGINLTGADLVEVAPMYDPTQSTQILGMSILFELVALIGT